jgi:hypothetical protein
MKIRILTVCLTVFLLSCYNENENEIRPAKEPSSEIVPIETARDVAIKLAQREFSTSATLTEKAASNVPHIKNEDVVAKEKVPYFYIFNFDEGFAIISAEKYEHPILAYSQTGEFVRKDAPQGVQLWLETTKESIDLIRSGRIDTKKTTFAEWNIAQRKAVPDQAVSRVAPPAPGCQETSTTTIVGPLIKTTWNQGCGYNAYCPLVTSGGDCGRAWTGCVATSMAQVMRYWQKPTTYSWSTMPNTYGNSAVALLMSDAGTSVGMDYGGDGSGASMSNVPGALKNIFHYTSASHIEYGLSSYNTVKSNVSAKRPVILSGFSTRDASWLGLVVKYKDGHAWVCDGYNETSYTWCNDDGSFGGGATYLYFHLNWGWGGSSDGYYGFDNWAPTGTSYNFKYARGAIVSIVP